MNVLIKSSKLRSAMLTQTPIRAKYVMFRYIITTLLYIIDILVIPVVYIPLYFGFFIKMYSSEVTQPLQAKKSYLKSFELMRMSNECFAIDIACNLQYQLICK